MQLTTQRRNALSPRRPPPPPRDLATPQWIANARTAIVANSDILLNETWKFVTDKEDALKVSDLTMITIVVSPLSSFPDSLFVIDMFLGQRRSCFMRNKFVHDWSCERFKKRALLEGSLQIKGSSDKGKRFGVMSGAGCIWGGMMSVRDDTR